MSEVQRHALLSADEEKRLAEEYTRTGNVDIAARLVTANLRLVVKLAYEYRRACRNIMDFDQEGNIGLMQAVRRYDPYRGVKLSSYAAWWIRAYMLRYILNNWRLVKLGTTQAQRKLFFNFE
ncbi:MAG: sigma-70 family RNA polymerase sigma factor [Polyangiaceae bacterium]